jgi:Mce-associated membrane protein
VTARHRQSGYRSTIASVVAAALCVPAALGVVLLVGKVSSTTDENAARHGALRAAAGLARDILSYDYRTIDRDLARARADTTGEFAGQYASAAAELRSEARRTQAIVQARVRDTGIVAATGDQVVVLVFADQVSITRTAAAVSPTTRVIPSAVQLTLTRDGDRWRVSALTAVQTGAPSAAG